VETQFVREPLMRLSKKVVAALSSQDVQQTIWLPRFVHLVTHAKTPAPDDLLARMARRGATLATMSSRLIDHTVQGRGPCAAHLSSRGLRGWPPRESHERV
jgi:hypothetical protein